MESDTRLRAVGHPPVCARNLAKALQALRRQEDTAWVIDKLKVAGLMGSDASTVHAGGLGRNKTQAEGPSVKAKRHLFNHSSEDGLPVEGLKYAIRALKLNTGQNFWKNNVTREDFLKVLFCHFKAHQPIRSSKSSAAAETMRSAAQATADVATKYDRLRQGLLSASIRHVIATDDSITDAIPSFVELLAPTRQRASKQGLVKPQKPSSFVEIGWRDLQQDFSDGILYQARVGFSRNSVKEIALRQTRPIVHELSGSHLGFLASFGETSGDDLSEQVRDTDVKRQEEHSRLMRRKCAKSIYELSMRPDKVPPLIENGGLEALSVLSMVDDPRTMRYVGASYVNLAALGHEYCVEMLKTQV